MSSPLNRRHFLRNTLACAAGTTLAGSVLSGCSTLISDKRFFASRPLGVQLYILGDMPNKDLDASFQTVAKIGYREVELPGLFAKEPKLIKAAADKAGLTLSSIQLGANPMYSPDKVSLLSDNQKIIDALGELNITNVLLPIPQFPRSFRPTSANYLQQLADAFHAEGADIWKRTAQLLNEKAAALKPHGITMGYHNHNIEFAPIGNTTGWNILAAETDPDLVYFEADTAWLWASRVNPVDFLQQHRGRVKWLHVKDLKADTPINFSLQINPTEVGSGTLDWQRLLTTAAETGVKHFFVEQEPPFTLSRIEAASKSYHYLQNIKG